MKVCIYGAGAIGGYLGVQLAHSGAADVSLVARGAHLQAIRERGGYDLMPEWETRPANQYLPRRVTKPVTRGAQPAPDAAGAEKEQP